MRWSVWSTAGVIAFGALAMFFLSWGMWDPVGQRIRETWVRYQAHVGSQLQAIYSQDRATSFAMRHALLIVFGFAAGALVTLPFGVGCAVLFGYLPFMWLERKQQQRRKALEAQLDATLQSLANTILVTSTLEEGFATIAQHFEAPIGQEADLLVKQVRLGTPMDEALKQMAQRCHSRNVDAIVTALTIGRQTGGELPKVLETTAAVLRETMRVEGVMETRTAEGKAQMILMTALPFLFVGGVNALAPDWMAPLWGDPLGWGILSVACVLYAVGLLWGRKVRAIEV